MEGPEILQTLFQTIVEDDVTRAELHELVLGVFSNMVSDKYNLVQKLLLLKELRAQTTLNLIDKLAALQAAANPPSLYS